MPFDNLYLGRLHRFYAPRLVHRTSMTCLPLLNATLFSTVNSKTEVKTGGKRPSWAHIPVSLPGPVDKAGMMQAAGWTPHSTQMLSRREFQLHGPQPRCLPGFIYRTGRFYKEEEQCKIIIKTKITQWQIL